MRILITLFIFTPLLSYSQKGPGGVRDTDGIDINLWLDANRGVFNNAGTTSSEDGETVQQWNDQSGNDYHSSQTSTSAKPSYETNNGANGYPAITFDAEGASNNAQVDYLDLSPFVGDIINKDQSMFFVSTNSTISDDVVIYSSSSTTIQSIGRFNGYGQPGQDILEFHVGFNAQADLFIQDDGNSDDSDFLRESSGGSTTAASSIVYAEWDAGGTSLIKSNNNTGSSGTAPDNRNTPVTLFIGRHASSNVSRTRSFDGDLSEVIIFDEIINDVEQVLVHNYLAAKYGLTLDDDDIYIHDNVANGNFDHDVAGIGRIGTNRVSEAQGTGIVRIEQPTGTGFGSNEFMIWGHDNGILRALELTDVPSDVYARFVREWSVSEVRLTDGVSRNVGNVNVSFDLTDQGNVTASDLRLVVDANGDGDYTDAGDESISGATDEGGNVFQFSNISALVNNSRFTLGSINTAQTPLPIELLNFTAESTVKNTVKLNWQTVTEVNNNYFTIEKSSDGINWNTVSTVNGAGNSLNLLNYSSLDNNPYSGTTYYRLKQTDFNGQHSYSEIKSINISLDSDIEIYPNPTNGQITIEGSQAEIEQLSIFNSLGIDLTSQIRIIEQTDSQQIIDISNLVTGLYFLKTKSTVNTVLKR